MEFKYIGNPHVVDNRGELMMFGIRFPLNVPIKVEHEWIAKKLMGNDHFAICGPDGETHVQVKAPKLILPEAMTANIGTSTAGAEGALKAAKRSKRA
jgi:hypothetical protein